MGRAALDFMVFGEAYFQRLRNIIGQVLELRHLPAINMRRKVGGGFVMLLPNGQELHFAEDEVEHVMDYDVEQDVYGVPDYLGGLHSLLLNESATLSAVATTTTAHTLGSSSTPTIPTYPKTTRKP